MNILPFQILFGALAPKTAPKKTLLIAWLLLTSLLVLWPFASLHAAESIPVVAVIDTGIDVSNPVLSKSLWINPGESGIDSNQQNRATNQVDDDQNGFVDDVHGYNFASDTGAIDDDHGHGSHISGIIQQEAPMVKLMILKYWSPKEQKISPLNALIRAFVYAKKMNAVIVNYSGGGFVMDPLEQSVLENLNKAGILVVAAAGNEATNSDQKQFYPASYGFPNILSVASMDQNQNLLPSSNWGIKSVHLSAPGKQIWSWGLAQKKTAMSGTSQATAFVTGLAARLWGSSPRFHKIPRLISHIKNTSAFNSRLSGRTQTSSALAQNRSLYMKPNGLTPWGQTIRPRIGQTSQD